MDAAPTRRELRKNLRQLLRAVLEERPMDLDARMRVARTLRLLKSPEQAINHYQQVARYLSLAGKPLMAIMVLKELLQVDPKHQETLMFIAKLYARTGKKWAWMWGVSPSPFKPSCPTAWPCQTGCLKRPKHSGTRSCQSRPRRHDSGDCHRRPRGGRSARCRRFYFGRHRRHPRHQSLRGNQFATQHESEEPRTVDEGRRGAQTVGEDSGAVEGKDIAEHFNRVGVPEAGQGVLPDVPLFSKLSTEAFIHLIEGLIYRRVAQGEVVFAEGDEGDSFFVVVEGEATVSRKVNDEDIAMSVLKSRDCAGVFGLMAAETRQATLTANTEMDLLEIKRAVIEDLLHVDPAMRSVLADFFRDRLVMNLLTILPVFATLPMEARASFGARV